MDSDAAQQRLCDPRMCTAHRKYAEQEPHLIETSATRALEEDQDFMQWLKAMEDSLPLLNSLRKGGPNASALLLERLIQSNRHPEAVKTLTLSVEEEALLVGGQSIHPSPKPEEDDEEQISDEEADNDDNEEELVEQHGQDEKGPLSSHPQSKVRPKEIQDIPVDVD